MELIPPGFNSIHSVLTLSTLSFVNFHFPPANKRLVLYLNVYVAHIACVSALSFVSAAFPSILRFSDSPLYILSPVVFAYGAARRLVHLFTDLTV